MREEREKRSTYNGDPWKGLWMVYTPHSDIILHIFDILRI